MQRSAHLVFQISYSGACGSLHDHNSVMLAAASDDGWPKGRPSLSFYPGRSARSISKSNRSVGPAGNKHHSCPSLICKGSLLSTPGESDHANQNHADFDGRCHRICVCCPCWRQRHPRQPLHIHCSVLHTAGSRRRGCVQGLLLKRAVAMRKR